MVGSMFAPTQAGFNPQGIASYGVAAPAGSIVDPMTNAIRAAATTQGSSSFGSTPGAAGVTGIQVPELGFNIPTFQLALGGLQTIGNLWNAFQMSKLAKDQFAYTKDVTETNLANQIQSYNTTLEDRIRSRAAFENGHNGGMRRSEVGGYLEEHKLTRQPRQA